MKYTPKTQKRLRDAEGMMSKLSWGAPGAWCDGGRERGHTLMWPWWRGRSRGGRAQAPLGRSGGHPPERLAMAQVLPPASQVQCRDMADSRGKHTAPPPRLSLQAPQCFGAWSLDLCPDEVRAWWLAGPAVPRGPGQETSPELSCCPCLFSDSAEVW